MKFIKKNKYSDTKVLDEPCIIDIETSWNHDEEEPISWITSIQVYFNKKLQLFRKPSELMSYLLDLIHTYDLNKDRQLMIVIHNQSYDLSYLLPYIQKDLPFREDHNSLLLDEHKIINYRQGGLDFRCSYLLTRKSLEALGNDFNVQHKKKIGLYNYEAIHYQDDKLSKKELEYAAHDVLSLYECFQKQLELHGDTTATVPYTHTGYIRRVLRRSCSQDKYYRNTYFRNTRLQCESYKFCLNSYAGGYTHNNRFYRDRVVYPEKLGKVGKHRDFRSHYPTQLVHYPLPFGKPMVYYDVASSTSRYLSPDIDIDEILNLYPKFSTITHIAINSVSLRDPMCSMPFMQESKMYFPEENKDKFRILSDNGRVIKVTSRDPDEYFETYVDNHTLKILNEQYDIDYVILKVIRFRNRQIPACIKNVIDDLFRSKSDLKYVVKECEKKYGKFAEETVKAEAELMLAKSLLNSIYGCLATNPVRESYDIDTDKRDLDGNLIPIYVSEVVQSDQEIQEALDKYYRGRKNFLPYQVGCFCTALAKYELYEYIKAIGYENVLYCDTDSCYYLSDPEIEKRVEALNREKNKTAPYVTDSKGKVIYYDVFEEEPDFLAFKGLHSKCYGVVITGKDGRPELQVTIAGVPARTLIAMRQGSPLYLTREEELSGITKSRKKKDPDIRISDPYAALDKLEDDVRFRTNTGSTCRYEYREPDIIMINGHEIETAGGAIIQLLTEKKVKNLDLEDEVDFTPITMEVV